MKLVEAIEEISLRYHCPYCDKDEEVISDYNPNSNREIITCPCGEELELIIG